jgi:hypothetical protein
MGRAGTETDPGIGIHLPRPVQYFAHIPDINRPALVLSHLYLGQFPDVPEKGPGLQQQFPVGQEEAEYG